MKLYEFIDRVLTLPAQLELRYNDYIHKLEEDREVRYITSAERIGEQRGIEIGEQRHLKAIREIALRMLRAGIKKEDVAIMTQLDISTLNKLEIKEHA